jgi:pimeloyl-ACP methyl ester carboxylesterase
MSEIGSRIRTANAASIKTLRRYVVKLSKALMTIMNRLWMRFLIVVVFTGLVSAATVDGIDIHSSISGKGPRTVILVHGWTCDETTWKSQVPALAGDFQIITLDLPGHGRSGSPKDGKFSMDLFARAIEAVRSEAKVDRVVLAGHSMGTPVIIQYARLYPQHTVALVLVDGLVSAPPQSIVTSITDRFAGPDGLKAREGMIRSMFSAATTPEIQKHILSMMLGAPAATAVGAMKAALDPAIWKDDVFNIPVLALYSDSPSDDGTGASMKSRIPALEYHKIPNTGHFLMLEKPEEFNRLLKDFRNYSPS